MKNKGISLITLVITIIIMIILAGAIILTLTQSNIFNKANEAVGKYNLKEVQAMMDLAYAENYDKNLSVDDMQDKLNKVLKENELDQQYKVTVTEKGATVTEIGGSGNGGQGGTATVPTNWQENVVAIVDGVPIPKGFVASPYDGTDGMPAENTKAGGLVIYALNEGETSIPATETHQHSLENRNQFVWVPVDKENFATEFVRDGFGWYDGNISDTVGSDGYWELELEDDNAPSDTQNSSFVSDATLTEAKAMYASVAEYGGFYIARYEVGKDASGNVSITMGKYPYNHVAWGTSMENEEKTNGAVTLSRAFYPNTSDNTTGVVSTLTYGVQWDTTLNWWKTVNPEIDLEDSTEYGNYYNTSIEEGDYNENAKYIGYDQDAWEFVGSWNDAVAKKYDEENDAGQSWLLTTGAFKNASVNNIYDMAGNLWEWTMEGYSSDFHFARGGGFNDNSPVILRSGDCPYSERDFIGFRSALYIKK